MFLPKLVPLALVVLVTVSAGAARAGDRDSRLERAVGLPVVCWTDDGWRAEAYALTGVRPSLLDGFWGRGAINLAPWNCRVLRRFVRGWRPREFAERVMLRNAILTLGHEAAHARGMHSEATAERYAWRGLKALIRRLGGDQSYARALARS